LIPLEHALALLEPYPARREQVCSFSVLDSVRGAGKDAAVRGGRFRPLRRGGRRAGVAVGFLVVCACLLALSPVGLAGGGGDEGMLAAPGGGGDEGMLAAPLLEKNVRICHATSAETNPYRSEEFAIESNGDLKGGHLGHTGPVFPAAGWGDIIPPYDYVDTSGATQVSLGLNWSPEGQAIWQNGCSPPAEPSPKPLIPLPGCVEGLASGGFRAHFGYENPNPMSVEPPAGENVFTPGLAYRGQPRVFVSQRFEDVSRWSRRARR
jgi:hypothetical protein